MSTAPKTAVSRSAGETADKPTVAERAPTHEEIARLAHNFWEARGRPLGSPEEDWFAAEQDLLMERLVWGRRPQHALK
jgi:hypothetical protein